ncbi:hypothetical protein AAY80_259 [Stenotrophomonas phage vB_SmaS-DLP_6]|nr:hypothetical protein AAY80_259 [Stenotrophomonas phage vB_SmaS-DLP_6]
MTLTTFLLLLVIAVLVVALVMLSTWYGTVHPRYERKYRHQEEQLQQAAKTNRKVLYERDVCVQHIKAIEKDRDEWRHTASVYYRKWQKGGGAEETIRTVTKTVTVNPFTREELTWLLQQAHPDKHGGKPFANAMTQKLNQLRSTTK